MNDLLGVKKDTENTRISGHFPDTVDKGTGGWHGRVERYGGQALAVEGLHAFPNEDAICMPEAV
jgi:hypothetical protein